MSRDSFALVEHRLLRGDSRIVEGSLGEEHRSRATEEHARSDDAERQKPELSGVYGIGENRDHNACACEVTGARGEEEDRHGYDENRE